MTERVTWICDGCDKQIVRRPNETVDWKLYPVTLGNAKGYPLCAAGEFIEIEAHLCPGCAKELAEKINPRNWTRIAPPPIAA